MSQNARQNGGFFNFNRVYLRNQKRSSDTAFGRINPRLLVTLEKIWASNNLFQKLLSSTKEKMTHFFELSIGAQNGRPRRKNYFHHEIARTKHFCAVRVQSTDTFYNAHKFQLRAPSDFCGSFAFSAGQCPFFRHSFGPFLGNFRTCSVTILQLFQFANHI